MRCSGASASTIWKSSSRRWINDRDSDANTFDRGGENTPPSTGENLAHTDAGGAAQPMADAERLRAEGRTLLHVQDQADGRLGRHRALQGARLRSPSPVALFLARRIEDERQIRLATRQRGHLDADAGAGRHAS